MHALQRIKQVEILQSAHGERNSPLNLSLQLQSELD